MTVSKRIVDLTAYDEDTMTRVRGVLKEYIGVDQYVTEIINSLQNFGILFRERPYDEERVPLTEVPREVTQELAELRKENKLMSVSLSEHKSALRSIRALLDAVL